MDREAYAKKNKYYSYTKKKISKRLMPALRRLKSIMKNKVKSELKEKIFKRGKFIRQVSVSSEDSSFVYESSHGEPGAESSDEVVDCSL